MQFNSLVSSLLNGGQLPPYSPLLRSPVAGEWVSPHCQSIYVRTWAWKEEPFGLKHIVVRGKFHHHYHNNATTKLSKLHKYECVCMCMHARVCVCAHAHVCEFMSVRGNIVFSLLKSKKFPSWKRVSSHLTLFVVEIPYMSCFKFWLFLCPV